MAEANNDNGNETIHAATWQDALHIGGQTNGATFQTEDGWFFMFGTKLITPRLANRLSSVAAKAPEQT